MQELFKAAIERGASPHDVGAGKIYTAYVLRQRDLVACLRFKVPLR